MRRRHGRTWGRSLRMEAIKSGSTARCRPEPTASNIESSCRAPDGRPGRLTTPPPAPPARAGASKQSPIQLIDGSATRDGCALGAGRRPVQALLARTRGLALTVARIGTGAVAETATSKPGDCAPRAVRQDRRVEVKPIRSEQMCVPLSYLIDLHASQMPVAAGGVRMDSFGLSWKRFAKVVRSRWQSRWSWPVVPVPRGRSSGPPDDDMDASQRRAGAATAEAAAETRWAAGAAREWAAAGAVGPRGPAAHPRMRDARNRDRNNGGRGGSAVDAATGERTLRRNQWGGGGANANLPGWKLHLVGRVRQRERLGARSEQMGMRPHRWARAAGATDNWTTPTPGRTRTSRMVPLVIAAHRRSVEARWNAATPLQLRLGATDAGEVLADVAALEARIRDSHRQRYVAGVLDAGHRLPTAAAPPVR